MARILVVDDNDDVRQLVGNVLSAEGYKVAYAANGEIALDSMRHEPPDLVILDIMMPEVDGYEVFRVLKSQERTSHIPVIFLTAKSTQDDIEKGLALGADYYITKPFSGADLVRKVKILLEQHRLGQAAGA